MIICHKGDKMAQQHFEDGSGSYVDSLMKEWLQVDKKVWSRILVPYQAHASTPRLEDIVHRYSLARKNIFSIIAEMNSITFFPPTNQGPKM